MPKHRTHTYETKAEVVHRFLRGEATGKLVKEYQIGHRSRIYEWTEKVKKGGYEALLHQRGAKSKGRPKKQPTEDYHKWIEEENKRLRLQVNYLKKLLDLERG